MKLDTFDREIEATNQRVRKLLVDKNNDYSDKDYVHDNFLKQALILRILGVNMYTIKGAIVGMIVVKLIRICNLIFNDKLPRFEGVEDSCDDLLGYTHLLRVRLKEETET